jgi:hypothetical protein
MQVKCSKCAQPIALTDIIESSDGCLSHLDCRRPNGLTANERALLFVHCFNHAVARCLPCDASFRFTELGADRSEAVRTCALVVVRTSPSTSVRICTAA